MNDRGVVTLVRGWVELYTRGLPPAIRAGRRDEVDDDLWCQHEEAVTVGRSPRSVAAEILVRLFMGMPADLSWRASQGRTRSPVPPPRSPSTPSRLIGALAIIGGATWGTLIFFTIFYTPGQWTGASSSADAVLTLVGGIGLTGAMIGPAALFQDRLRPGVGIAAAGGTMGTVLVTLGGYQAFLVVPVASAFLVWELARLGVVSRALAVFHGLSGAAFMALIVSSQINYEGTLSNHLLVALGVPYMLTWVVIGAAFLRGVPAAHEPMREG
jgi:hypothetical protein